MQTAALVLSHNGWNSISAFFFFFLKIYRSKSTNSLCHVQRNTVGLVFCCTHRFGWVVYLLHAAMRPHVVISCQRALSRRYYLKESRGSRRWLIFLEGQYYKNNQNKTKKCCIVKWKVFVLFQVLETGLYVSLWSRICRRMVLLQQGELRQPLRDHEKADELFQVASNENRSALLDSSTRFTASPREVVRGKKALGSASDVSIISKEKIKWAGAHLAVLLQPSSPRHNVASA